MTSPIESTTSETSLQTSTSAPVQAADLKVQAQNAIHDSGKPAPAERFQSIQVLRAIAAIAVLLFHIRAYLQIIGGVEQSIFSIFTEVFANGATLFFSISGFLMAHLISTGYRNFLPRRFLRIYPTFFIAVALALALRALAFGPVPQPNLLAALTLLPVGRIHYPLNIEWTLIYEVFFYLVCTPFTFKATRRFLPAFLIAWLAVIVFTWVSTNTAQLPLPTYDTIFFQVYNIYFIVGGLTYYLTRHTPPLPKAACISLTLVIVGTIIMWPILKTIPWFWRYESFIFAIYAMTILLVALSMKIGVPERIKQTAIKLGDYSYGIYLIHVPVMVTILYYYKLNIGELGSAIGVFALVVTLICGCYLGKLDVFIHRWISKTIFPSSRRTDLSVARARGRIW